MKVSTWLNYGNFRKLIILRIYHARCVIEDMFMHIGLMYALENNIIIMKVQGPALHLITAYSSSLMLMNIEIVLVGSNDLQVG